MHPNTLTAIRKAQAIAGHIQSMIGKPDNKTYQLAGMVQADLYTAEKNHELPYARELLRCASDNAKHIKQITTGSTKYRAEAILDLINYALIT